jgi:hypothetical protein
MRIYRTVVGLALSALAALYAGCDSTALTDSAPERGTSGVLSSITSSGNATGLLDQQPLIRIGVKSGATVAEIASTEPIDSVVIFTDAGGVYTWTNLGLRFVVLRITDGSRIANVCVKSGKGSKWFLDEAKWYQDGSKWYPDSGSLGLNDVKWYQDPD